jgi:Flp pilus assembly protein TadG
MRRSEAGVTMILVAICMVAIIAMAALSIDVVTLYLARMEAQRTADTAALAAAKLISASGITGDAFTDTISWQAICGTTGIATQTAQAVASQTIENVSPTVNVYYSSQGAASTVTDCSTLTSAFAINPTVIVQVTRSGMPTLFSRIWSRNTNSVSATAMAEAFNPSNSGSIASGGEVIPVTPRCVKPWMVPNLDPQNAAAPGFVDAASGQIKNPGILLGGTGANAVIGETFWLASDCRHTGSSCTLRATPQVNYYLNPYVTVNPNLLYLPGQAPASTPVAVPSAASGGSLWEQAIAGCDQATIYQCGVQNANTIDLSENPQSTSDMIDGVEELTHQGTVGAIDGQDTLNDAAYPFQILAGSSNPVGGGSLAGDPVTSSPSVVTVPIYDPNLSSITTGSTGTIAVTIVGFLQVFITEVDQYSNVKVTVLNVSGCGNGTNPAGTAVAGSSPVPVRLITQ